MANTFTQIHLHLVFVVQNRASLISTKWENRLYKYISGIIQNNDHKLLAINGMPDHIHILIGMRPTQSLSELMQDIKGDSSKWINENRLVNGKFVWQQGYGAFSYSKSQIPKVINYIKNQKKHHQKVLFIEEYKKILDDFGISFDERYIFKSIKKTRKI
ncbi:MAG: IS200/IS605 family transposase [Bacteroidales bacterium]|nr:IS200/IS605 family transposase [Bacteroidales bacterium]